MLNPAQTNTFTIMRGIARETGATVSVDKCSETGTVLVSERASAEWDNEVHEWIMDEEGNLTLL